MKRWLDCGMEAGTKEGRRAIARLVWWMVGLSLLVALAMVAADRVLEADATLPIWARAAITLTPMLPFVAMFVVFARTYRHLDELIVRMQSEALALTLAVTVVVCVAWGQLQEDGLVPAVEPQFVWPLAAVTYVPCLFFIRQRYG